jgi:hypothetical protein
MLQIGSAVIVGLCGREALIRALHRGALRLCRWTLSRRSGALRLYRWGLVQRSGGRVGSPSQSVPAQQLCYLLEKVAAEGVGAFSEIRVSVWVAQRGADVGSIIPGSACAFAPRFSRGVPSAGTALEFPRYVDGEDRDILQVLAAGIDGPWMPRGEVGTGLLLRIAATGRSFCIRFRGGLCVAARRARWLLSGSCCQVESRL